MKKSFKKTLILGLAGMIFLTNTNIAFAMYDPYVGRFTTRDPVRGRFKEPMSLHPYLYCQNDPINRVDLNGMLSYKVLVAPTIAGYATHALAIAFVAYGVAISSNAGLTLGIAIEQAVGGVMVLVGAGVDYWDALAYSLKGGKQKDRDNFGKLSEIGNLK